MAHPGEFELISRYFARGNGRAATLTGVNLA